MTPSDDGFHPVVREPEHWAETAWFAADVPDEDLVIWFYPLFRPELGVMSCGIYVFGPGTAEPWEMQYYRQVWQQAIPPEAKGPCELRLPNSLSYEVLEPLRRYRLRYDDAGEFSADLTFTALHDPHELGVGGGIGHIDQFGRLRGTVELRGRTIAVDSIEMRDRTWGPRRELKQKTRLGYSYGADRDGRGFHCSVRFDAEDTSRFMTGFFLADGATTELLDAERTVERDAAGRPVAVTLRVRDAAGEHEITGVVRGQMTLYTSPYVVFVSSVRWTLPDGGTAYGEDQDTWSPGRLRAYRRAEGFTAP
ncbi:hypothetical protein [Nocardia harenae]|uniref:hypothetical protein n=1 Tax=Nocardia harenae TaxID=358707 RepID=UPI00082C242C|nr:hypothetical protein [Nocardia harenae]